MLSRNFKSALHFSKQNYQQTAQDFVHQKNRLFFCAAIYLGGKQ
jgi:hypothetical protein